MTGIGVILTLSAEDVGGQSGLRLPLGLVLESQGMTQLPAPLLTTRGTAVAMTAIRDQEQGQPASSSSPSSPPTPIGAKQG